MKIAVSAQGSHLTSLVDERFGRGAFFIIVDPVSLEFETIKNDENTQQGAGVNAAKTVVNSGADIVITGSCGQKAFRILKEANVNVILNANGRVIDVVQQYKNGMFTKALKPNSTMKANEECINAF